MTKQVEAHRLPMEALTAMSLPEVPEELSRLLSVTWKGRGMTPATSAVGAITDKSGQPIAVATLVYKKYIHEEDIPFKDIHREVGIFVEVAKDLL